VIRLVTQFDSVETHPSLATPTCGGCCSSCCCCCLASAIGASSLAAIHVSSLQREVPPEDRKRGGPLLAFFALPIAIALGAITAGWGLFVAPVVWGLVLWLAYRRAGAEHPVAFAIMIAALGSVAVVVEFFVALAMVDSLDAYLPLSVLVGASIAFFGYVATR